MNSNTEFKMIAELDLDSIKLTVMHNEAGEGWSQERANAVEFEYRRFLYVMKLFPHAQTAPLLDVDIFWHYHILDTMKYAADCAQIFGYFLHHSPDNGQRGEDDQAAHDRAGAHMQELYEATFDDAYIGRDEGKATIAGVQPASEQTAWCTPATRSVANNAWCTPAIAATAWCTPAITKTAWCTPAIAPTAWCTPTIAKSAWCTPAIAKSAWCTPAIAKSAWCTPAIAKSAWCTPMTEKTSQLRSEQATTVRPQPAAANDRIFTRSAAKQAA